MAVQIRCVQCGHRMRLASLPHGGHISCGNCGARLKVPPASTSDTTVTASISVDDPKSSEQFNESDSDDIVDFASVLSPGSSPSTQFSGSFQTPPVLTTGEEDFDDSIDFTALSGEEMSPDTRVAFSLSAAQFHDVVKSAATTRGAVKLLALVLFVSLAVQGIVVVAALVGLLKSQSEGADIVAIVSAAMAIAAAVVTGVAATLLTDYGTRLGEFLQTKRAAEFVESFASAGRFWLTASTTIILTLGLGAIALAAMFFFRG